MLDKYKYESQCLAFSMPYNQILRIFRLSNFDMTDEFGDDVTIKNDAEIDGIIYVLRWNDIELPWCTKTELHATAIAFGCQWGAQQIFNMRYPNE